VKEIDVLVVGAGPAGGSSALHCSRNGLKTTIIEEHKVIGEPVHCGECLSEYATKNTGIKLPNEIISNKVNGVRVIFPNGKKCSFNEKGFVLEKEKFEQWLAGEAVNAGAELKLETKLEALEHKNGFWNVKTNKGNISAKVLIDASGVASVVSKKLGFNEKLESVTGIQYELKNIPREEYLDFFMWPELAPHGYLWMIPKSGTRANVGLVTTQRNSAKTFLDSFVKKMNWEKNEKVKTFGGLIPASGPMETTFSDSLMIVGDAAGFTSPLFEGGTHLGLKSGEIAALTAKKAFETNDFSKETFSEYQQKWKLLFPDYSKLVNGKKSLYAFSDDEFNLIGNSFPSNFDDFGSIAKIIFGAKILAKKPSIYTRGFLPAMKAFEYSQSKNYGW